MVETDDNRYGVTTGFESSKKEQFKSYGVPYMPDEEPDLEAAYQRLRTGAQAIINTLDKNYKDKSMDDVFKSVNKTLYLTPYVQVSYHTLNSVQAQHKA